MNGDLVLSIIGPAIATAAIAATWWKDAPRLARVGILAFAAVISTLASSWSGAEVGLSLGLGSLALALWRARDGRPALPWIAYLVVAAAMVADRGVGLGAAAVTAWLDARERRVLALALLAAIPPWHAAGLVGLTLLLAAAGGRLLSDRIAQRFLREGGQRMVVLVAALLPGIAILAGLMLGRLSPLPTAASTPVFLALGIGAAIVLIGISLLLATQGPSRAIALAFVIVPVAALVGGAPSLWAVLPSLSLAFGVGAAATTRLFGRGAR